MEIYSLLVLLFMKQRHYDTHQCLKYLTNEVVYGMQQISYGSFVSWVSKLVSQTNTSILSCAYFVNHRPIAFELTLKSLFLFFIYKVRFNDAVWMFNRWTFILVTIYFGFGSLLSIYGCYQNNKMCMASNGHYVGIDAEQGLSVPLTYRETAYRGRVEKNSNHQEKNGDVPMIGILCYAFQVIFQVSAGAVMLTDCVYWFVIFPFLTIKDYDMNSLTILTHTLNAVLLLGDTALNCLRFPWFRISYFTLWTGVYVIFQWIVHACIPLWWPYPFLDLSIPNAPIWYLLVALMHIPCYGAFALIMKLKHCLLSRWFPQSYQSLR